MHYIGPRFPGGQKSQSLVSRGLYIPAYNHFSRYSLREDSFFLVFALCELVVLTKRWWSADSVDNSSGLIRRRGITTKSVNQSKF